MVLYTLNESLVFVQTMKLKADVELMRTLYPVLDSAWFETWPEKKAVKIVIDLCKFERDNHDRAVELGRGLQKIFAPSEGELIVTRRTVEDMGGW